MRFASVVDMGFSGYLPGAPVSQKDIYWHTYAKARISSFVLLVCCLYSTVGARAQSDTFEVPHHNQQLAPELDLYYRTGTRTDITLLSQAKLSANLPNPEIWLVGVDANVVVNNHLLITPSYYYYQFDQARGTGRGQNLVLAASFQKRLGRYTAGDRNRIIGFLTPGGEFWAYGNRLRLERTIGLEGKRLSLIAWDELFFFSSTDSWQRNRVALGFHKGLNDRVAIEPYYHHQIDGHTRSGDVDALGVIFKVRVH